MDNNTKNLQKAQQSAKSFIDANVWNGEDGAGASSDMCAHTPDELQELINELLEYLFET